MFNFYLLYLMHGNALVCLGGSLYSFHKTIRFSGLAGLTGKGNFVDC